MTLAQRLGDALVAGFPNGATLLAADERADEFVAEADVAPAAVLVPITDRPEPGVILTQRTETLRRHPGQVAFPGGRIDPGEDAVTAALREAEEEIALPRSVVTVIGSADRYRSITGYSITPVVGVVPPDLVLIPSEAEVAAVFEVPLAYLLDATNQIAVTADIRGVTRSFFEIRWQDRRIWGVTAAIIVNLARRLKWV